MGAFGIANKKYKIKETNIYTKLVSMGENHEFSWILLKSNYIETETYIFKA